MRTTKDVKQNKGITLIALVITIIVMLILVAVTITMAVNGGLFEYAGKAATQTNNAIDAEQQLASGRIKVGNVWYDSIDHYINKIPSSNQGEEETPENPEEPDTPTGEEDETPAVALSEINVGDYISNYISYENVVDIDDQKFTGWRVLSKVTDEDGNITSIKLVSAGVPLTYSTEVGSAVAIDYDSVIADLTTNFLTTQVNSETVEAYKFYQCGFNLPEGTNNLTSVFANDFTNKVQSLTYEDVLDVTGEVDMYNKPANGSAYADLIAIPQKDNSSYYIETILASKCTSYYGMWCVGLYGNIVNSDFFYQCTVRPVVTLKPEVIFKEATTKINNTPTYEITLPEQN